MERRSDPVTLERGGPAALNRDLALLTTTRALRGFGAGLLSVVLAIELSNVGYSGLEIGTFLGLAMGGGALWAVLAPRAGRSLPRSLLFVLGALGVVVGGLGLAYGLADPVLVVVALLLGGVVAGGSDVSPLGALEQGTLSRVVRAERRTSGFAAYNLAGYLGTAAGALAAAPVTRWALSLPGLPPLMGGPALLLYALVGLPLLPLYLELASDRPRGGAPPSVRPLSPQHRRPLLELSALFTVDAFGGGLIANTLVAYFLRLDFDASESSIGWILALASVAAAVSLLLAVPLARRIGLIRTMVFTHIPSSVLLILFPFSPTLALAGVLWVGRATLSQMDVPTRQSYTQSIVPREEGEAAAGYTTAARSAQAFGGPVSGGLLGLGNVWLAGPFALAGSVKIAYDLALYQRFRHRPAPEESAAGRP